METPQSPLSEKQLEFLEALNTLKYRYLLFGGGTGGGKSYLGAWLFVSLAMAYPGTSYGIFRKNLTTLKRTTYQTFKKYMRKNGFKEGRDYFENKSDFTWTFPNGSVFFFMQMDVSTDPEWSQMGGLELTAAMIDEADEVNEGGFYVLQKRIGRNNENGEFAFIYLTCNPNQAWVRRIFYDPFIKGKLMAPYYFLESLIRDNPFIGAQAQELASDPTAPKQYRERYFMGNWNYIKDDHAIIQLQQLENSYVLISPPAIGDRAIGLDAAREGEDLVVMALWEGNTLSDLVVIDLEEARENPNFDFSGYIGQYLIDYAIAHNVPAERIAVDAVGNGGGVVDYCRGKKFFVQEFKSRSVTGIERYDPEGDEEEGMKKFDFIRSQSYWKMTRDLITKKCRILESIPYREELQKDLLAHQFSTDGKMLIVEGKDSVKKRLLGRSPDFSDAVIMGYWVKSLPVTGGRIITGKTAKSLLDKRRR